MNPRFYIKEEDNSKGADGYKFKTDPEIVKEFHASLAKMMTSTAAMPSAHARLLRHACC